MMLKDRFCVIYHSFQIAIGGIGFGTIIGIEALTKNALFFLVHVMIFNWPILKCLTISFADERWQKDSLSWRNCCAKKPRDK